MVKLKSFIIFIAAITCKKVFFYFNSFITVKTFSPSVYSYFTESIFLVTMKNPSPPIPRCSIGNEMSGEASSRGLNGTPPSRKRNVM